VRFNDADQEVARWRHEDMKQTITQSSLMVAIAIAVIYSVAIAEDRNESEDMQPLEAHMFHWISGSGQWRTPNEAFDPDAERMTMPWIKEYRVNWKWASDKTHMIGQILAHPDKADPILSATMYAFYNPVTNEVLQVHVARNGNLVVSKDEARLEPSHFGEAEISDATDFAADGTISVTRHSNVFEDALTQRSDVLSKRDDGSLELVRQWTWTKVPDIEN
jgi:hypothetical protein